MYEIKYSKESFEEVLQQAYDNLEPQDIKDLLNEAARLYKIPENKNDFIYNIANSVVKKRNISFKQWKAISAYVSECNRKQDIKNNKSF